jgi:hypothetical protein
MTRKLLPYENELIAQLGVTEEEYIDFLSAQIDYTISHEQRYATPQAGPAIPAIAAYIATATATTAGTLALVSTALTVIGIIFQVVAALIAEDPSSPRAQRTQRDQRFSPRFGFNSGQDLAQYGDPVTLIYCNTAQNPLGGVRVGTSLVWSSVESYGSAQFMQLLLVLGAASVKAIDFNRVAFGQLPLEQFSAANTWLYYEDNGPVNFDDKLLGDGRDPTRDGATGADDVCRIIDGRVRRDGYSQAFSPSSLTSIGVYDPIPLNVEIMERRSSGRLQWRNLGITIAANNYDTGDDFQWEVGNQFTIIFAKALNRQDKVAQEAAKDMRYQLVSSLDQAATYMLGTAKFRLRTVSDNINLDDNEVRAQFECTEAGRRPSTAYDRTKVKNWQESDLDAIEDAKDKLKDDVTDARITGPGALSSGTKPQLWESVRNVTNLDDYTYSVSFGATSSPTANSDFEGQPDDLANGDFELKLENYGQRNYDFTGQQIISWTAATDQQRSATIPKGGSIAVTRKILQSFLASKPKLDVAALRDALEDDLENARKLKDDVLAGKYNGNFRGNARDSAAFQAIKNEIDNLQDDLESKLKRWDLQKNSTSISGQEVLKRVGTNLDKVTEDITKIQNQIERRREDKAAILSDNISDAQAAYARFIKDAQTSFRGVDGLNYAAGTRQIKRRLARLKGQTVTDQIGVKAVRNALQTLIKDKEEALNSAKFIIKNWEELAGAGDDNFFTKCLVKIEYAAYQTVTACDFVRFAIRCKLFRRVSGRAKDYGQIEAPDGFKLSDNGIQGRMAFFKVLYKRTNAATYISPPIVFAVRRVADQDSFIDFTFKAPVRAPGASRSKWEFKIEPIGDIGAEVLRSGQQQFGFIKNSGGTRIYDHAGSQFAWTGSIVNISGNIKAALKERGPIYTNEWDLFSVRSDTQVQFSFDGGPEFRITAVTEQQSSPFSAAESSDPNNIVGKYSNLSMMALGIFSGRGVQDLRSVTAYVTQGKSSWIVNESTGARTYSADSTSYAPDIFADTVLDRQDGIGKFAKQEGIDWNGVALAKRFCKNSGLGCQLFMDGVIAEQTSWRQFWAETAPFSLLEFARIGGMETLIPAVPVSSAGVANRQVTVNALFTAGNVLEGSYKEEFIDYGSAVQDLVATVIYRETEAQDVFSRNASVTVSLRDVAIDMAVAQSFDLSQFVTQRAQAILFAKLLCNQRRHIRRGIEFKTFPTDTPISPGAYIYVDIGLNNWDSISSGIVMPGGALNAPLTTTIVNGTYSVLVYKSGNQTLSLDNIIVSSGIAAALAPYEGYMFVLGAKTERKRVFRVTEVQMDEEGEVTVKAMEHPCDTASGQLLSRIANFSDALFSVQ